MLILGGIVLLALALRLWGIKYGMPFAYQIDEERIYVRKATRMLHAHSINPHYQHNPPLYLHPSVGAFAKRLADKAKTVNPDMEVCFFTNSGSEANEMAAFVAKTYTGRHDFVAVQRAAGGPNVESVELLQRAAGVEREQRAVIAARATALGVSAEALLLGVVVARLASAPE